MQGELRRSLGSGWVGAAAAEQARTRRLAGGAGRLKRPSWPSCHRRRQLQPPHGTSRLPHPAAAQPAAAPTWVALQRFELGFHAVTVSDCEHHRRIRGHGVAGSPPGRRHHGGAAGGAVDAHAVAAANQAVQAQAFDDGAARLRSSHRRHCWICLEPHEHAVACVAWPCLGSGAVGAASPPGGSCRSGWRRRLGGPACGVGAARQQEHCKQARGACVRAAVKARSEVGNSVSPLRSYARFMTYTLPKPSACLQAPPTGRTGGSVYVCLARAPLRLGICFTTCAWSFKTTR